jgi:hypothetical protein
MKQVTIRGFQANQKAHVERTLRAVGFKISSRGKGEIAAEPAGARSGELADLQTELKKLDKRIRMTVDEPPSPEAGLG